MQQTVVIEREKRNIAIQGRIEEARDSGKYNGQEIDHNHAKIANLREAVISGCVKCTLRLVSPQNIDELTSPHDFEASIVGTSSWNIKNNQALMYADYYLRYADTIKQTYRDTPPRYTPVMFAADEGHTEIVELLIELGASKTIRATIEHVTLLDFLKKRIKYYEDTMQRYYNDEYQAAVIEKLKRHVSRLKSVIQQRFGGGGGDDDNDNDVDAVFQNVNATIAQTQRDVDELTGFYSGEEDASNFGSEIAYVNYELGDIYDRIIVLEEESTANKELYQELLKSIDDVRSMANDRFRNMTKAQIISDRKNTVANENLKDAIQRQNEKIQELEARIEARKVEKGIVVGDDIKEEIRNIKQESSVHEQKIQELEENVKDIRIVDEIQNAKHEELVANNAIKIRELRKQLQELSESDLSELIVADIKKDISNLQKDKVNLQSQVNALKDDLIKQRINQQLRKT